MNIDIYRTMPEQPETCTAATIMARCIDGFAYRYYWGSEGLHENDYQSRPSDDSMSIAELCRHIEQLVIMISKMLCCPVDIPSGGNETERRQATLAALQTLSNQLRERDPETIDEHEKFWLLFNGPLGDAISHVGQLNSWRRINGNPIPYSKFFNGSAPD